VRRGILILALIIAGFALGGVFPSAAASQGGGVIHRDSVPAPAPKHNIVGDPTWDRVSVYLPPSYYTSAQRRYPVLYFLHGFAADDRALVQGAYQNMNIASRWTA
jgi:S-formylglutathione hydrolase FrmB